MANRQGRECGPGLSAWWNVLPFFFANYALPRRDTARRVLGAAGSANERFHISVPGTCALCTFIIDRGRLRSDLPDGIGFTETGGCLPKTWRKVRSDREGRVLDTGRIASSTPSRSSLKS